MTPPGAEALSLLRLLAAVPAFGVYGYLLGGLIYAVQARDAGLPWRSVTGSLDDRALLLNGLQLLPFGVLALVFGAVAGAALLAWREREWVPGGARKLILMARARLVRNPSRRGDGSPPRRGRLRRAGFHVTRHWTWRGAGWCTAMLFLGFLGTAFALMVVAALGLDLPTGLDWTVLALGTGGTLAAGWPWHRPLEQRPLVMVAIAAAAVFGAAVSPLGLGIYFAGIAVGATAGALAIRHLHGAGEHRFEHVLHPEVLAAGAILVAALGMYYALDRPLSLQTVALDERTATALANRGYDTKFAGLLSATDTQVVVAACQTADHGYSVNASVIYIPRRERTSLRVLPTPYRFHGRTRSTLASTIIKDSIFSSEDLPSDETLCGGTHGPEQRARKARP